MNDWAVGLILIVVGLLFCLRGYLAMRFVIPLWGAIAGFFLGAGLVASFTDEGFLATLMGWLTGFGVAVLFGALAYLYYEVSVFIAMAAVGFVLGTTVTTALGLTWDWLIILIGITVAAALALFGILYDMPMALLTVLTATAGASAVLTGVFLILGKLDVADLEDPATPGAIQIEGWWYAVYAALAIAGIIAQVGSTARFEASLREQWAQSGGRAIRSA